MIFFGHLGLGITLARPWMGKERETDARVVLLGCLLPDLLDKPLYYGLSAWTGSSGDAIGLISGTRTLGHALLFLLLLLLASRWDRSRIAWALFLGASTHVLFDHLGDALSPWINEGLAPANPFAEDVRRLQGLLFPFLGPAFPEYPFLNAADHGSTIRKPHLWGTEILGALLLAWDYFRFSKSWRR